MATRTNRSRTQPTPNLSSVGRDFASAGRKSPPPSERWVGAAALCMLLLAGVLVGFMIGFGKSEKKPTRARIEVAQAQPSPAAAKPTDTVPTHTAPPAEVPPQPEPKKPEPKKVEAKKPEPKKPEPKKVEAKKPEPKPEPKAAVAEVSFAKVSAVFKANCILCHGDPTVKGGLDLRTMASIKKGGDSGPGVMPGLPAKSQIWTSIENGEMPPPNKPQLTDAEKKLIRDWIAGGAK